MDPTRWDRIEAICFAAMERLPADRAAYLSEACAGDAELRLEVETLLRQLDQDPSFLEQPLVDPGSLSLPDGPEADEAVPDAVGPYRVVRALGRGGMGDVYLVIRETEELRQQVAVKIIRRGRDTEEVLRRFSLERRILATLHHPHIAQLLDAGATADGRPYFVMEYVDGVPLDEYCARQRLDIAARIRLLRVICAAVQHAHQNLVVHRDLKPRNILVTAEGVLKLLDFGIGKVLAPTESLSPALPTRTDVRLLTPEYAAPEQIAGGSVTTATDVYGLGVLLYELLTGRHPFAEGRTSVAEIERAVLEANPARPSKAAGGREGRALAGDLDTIVLKALRKEPERRYPSAAALSDDLQRHLDGLPVSARPDTLGYRARKFIRRNAAGVIAAAIAFFALAATTVVSLVQSRRVARESERVTRERDKALEVRSFLMEMFGASGANRAVGDTVTARRLLDLQAANLDRLYGSQPELHAAMMEVLADGYDRLGLYQAAEPLARQALDLRRRVLPGEHPDVATSLNLFGWVTHELGRSEEAEPLLREAVAIRRRGGAPRRQDLSRSLNDLGVVLNGLKRYQDAETVLHEALTIRRAELGPEHRSVGITASNLAASYFFQKKVDDALRVQALAVAALQKSVGPDHQRTIVALGNLAAFKTAGGDLHGAAAEYRDLLARQTRLQGAEHPATVILRASLASVLYMRARKDRDPAPLQESEALYLEALRLSEPTFSPSHQQVVLMKTRLAWVRALRDSLTASRNRQ
jgi:eukaryotic-like serine/threonine-protein kinase